MYVCILLAFQIISISSVNIQVGYKCNLPVPVCISGTLRLLPTSVSVLLQKKNSFRGSFNENTEKCQETTTPAEQNTQDRAPVSARESEGSHTGGHQVRSAIPVSSGHTQPSCTGAEAPQAPMSSIPTEGELLRWIASNYLERTPPKCKADHDDFLTYIKKANHY